MLFILSLIVQIYLLRLAFSLFFRLFSTRQDDRNRRTEWRRYTWDDNSGWTDASGRNAGAGWNGQYRQYQDAYTQQTSNLSLAYATLGVTPEATDGEVRAAYKRLALQFHPDRFATASREAQIKAEEQFKKINDAYQTIKKKRGLD